jgi:hypothetical protein
MGAAIVGLVAALPVCLMMSLAVVPPAAWARDVLIVTIISAGALGPICGLLVYSIFCGGRDWRFTDSTGR